MYDAKPLQYGRRAALPVLILVALFAGAVAGQQHTTTVAPVLRGVEEQLTELTKDFARTISESSFKFCIADP
jgi:hypothetical protein